MGSEISKTRFQRKHIQLDQPSICCEEVAAEADAAALEAAKAFCAQLVDKGILSETKLKDPNFTSEAPGVRWCKTAEKWRVQIQNRKMGIEGGYFTEKAQPRPRLLSYGRSMACSSR